MGGKIPGFFSSKAVVLGFFALCYLSLSREVILRCRVQEVEGKLGVKEFKFPYL